MFRKRIANKKNLLLLAIVASLLTGAYFLLPAPPKDLLKNAKSFAVDADLPIKNNGWIHQHIWLSENKALIFHQGRLQGLSYIQPVLYDISTGKHCLLTPLETAINKSKGFHPLGIQPSPDGLHLLWREYPDYVQSLRRQKLPGAIVVADLNGKIVQKWMPPTNTIAFRLKWVDKSHWKVWFSKFENGKHLIKGRFEGDLNQPNRIKTILSQPTELAWNYPEIVGGNKEGILLLPAMTVAQANQSSTMKYVDYCRTVSYPVKERPNTSVFNHDATKIIWSNSFSNMTVADNWLARLFGRYLRDVQYSFDLRTSDAEGKNVKFLGRFYPKKNEYFSPHDLKWLPGDKNASFISNGKIYLVPVN